MRIALGVMAAMTTVALLGGSSASAQVSIKFQEVAGDLTHPVAMTPFPDGSGRTAIVEQSGTIRILDDKGRVRPEPFLSMTGRIVTLHDFFDERGVLGGRDVRHLELARHARQRHPHRVQAVLRRLDRALVRRRLADGGRGRHA